MKSETSSAGDLTDGHDQAWEDASSAVADRIAESAPPVAEPAVAVSSEPSSSVRTEPTGIATKEEVVVSPSVLHNFQEVPATPSESPPAPDERVAAEQAFSDRRAHLKSEVLTPVDDPPVAEGKEEDKLASPSSFSGSFREPSFTPPSPASPSPCDQDTGASVGDPALGVAVCVCVSFQW